MLLALVMIVKDEAASIEETLASVLPAVDHVVILDTGSTDGTQFIAHRLLTAELSEGRHLKTFSLLSEAFVDFSATRNRVLELLGDRCTFALMLSGDETVENPQALRAFCKTRVDCTAGAYSLRVKFGPSTVYDSPRLSRTSAGWRYQGVTHEVLVGPNGEAASERVEGVYIVHDCSRKDPGAQRRRWETDERLLQARLDVAPDDARATFYLAQTRGCLAGCWDGVDDGKAQALRRREISGYRQRILLGGWREEVFIAHLRIADALEKLGEPWDEVQRRYLDAYSHSPHRAEPLYAVAAHWHSVQNYALTHLYASRAAALDMPDGDALFVDTSVYRYRALDLVGVSAFYLGALAEGERAVRCALNYAPEDQHPRLLANLAHYDRRRQEQPCSR